MSDATTLPDLDERTKEELTPGCTAAIFTLTRPRLFRRQRSLDKDECPCAAKWIVHYRIIACGCLLAALRCDAHKRPGEPHWCHRCEKSSAHVSVSTTERL